MPSIHRRILQPSSILSRNPSSRQRRAAEAFAAAVVLLTPYPNYRTYQSNRSTSDSKAAIGFLSSPKNVPISVRKECHKQHNLPRAILDRHLRRVVLKT